MTKNFVQKDAVRSFVAGISTALALIFSAQTVRADVAFQYVAEVSTYSGTTGSTVAINIYLQETLISGTSYVLSQQGIFAAGYQINRTGGDGYISMQQSQATHENGQLTGADGTFSGGFASVTGFLNSSGTQWRILEINPAHPELTTLGTVDGATRKVLLGTETFTVGTVNSTFSLARKPGGVNTESNLSQTDLDLNHADLGITGAGDASFQIQINVATVPEPSSFALGGLAFCGLYRSWRRSRTGRTSERLSKV